MTRCLFISNVEDQFTPQCIVNIFYNEGIANIGRITLLPEDKFNMETMDPNKKYNKVYIEIIAWHDTVRAHNILACLNNIAYKPILFYDEENCWEIKINKRPSICYSPIHKNNTTVFVPSPLLYDASGNNGFLPQLPLLPLPQLPLQQLPLLPLQQLPLPSPYMYYPGVNTYMPPLPNYYPTLSNNYIVPFY